MYRFIRCVFSVESVLLDLLYWVYSAGSALFRLSYRLYSGGSALLGLAESLALVSAFAGSGLLHLLC